jgi:Ca-activated chloride channel homolog
LSSDYEILREFLPELNPDFLPEGGTNYTALLQTALEAFGKTDGADRFLIILSDGESTVDDWQRLVNPLRERSVKVLEPWHWHE